jgi:hypothetical protein
MGVRYFFTYLISFSDWHQQQSVKRTVPITTYLKDKEPWRYLHGSLYCNLDGSFTFSCGDRVLLYPILAAVSRLRADVFYLLMRSLSP